MIVKFLAKSKTFKGVRYNTGKVEKNKGELMRVSGFGMLQGMSRLMPQDYINYLQLVSSRNKRVIYPQLHVVISARGKENSKEELTDIASEWMQSMGYGDQPYLVIFHKDTRNHHVHIVSTRVDRSSGKKISSAYEKIRAMTAINRIMKQDEKLLAKVDLENAMKFNFQTRAQFMMILENNGYSFTVENGSMHLCKFGKKLLEIDPAFLKERKANYQVNKARASQVTALLHKYGKQCSAELRPDTIPLPGGIGRMKNTFTSDLAIHMKQAFGIQLLFHSAEGKTTPYGFSVLDHAEGNVFKGGEIMELDELLSLGSIFKDKAVFGKIDTPMPEKLIASIAQPLIDSKSSAQPVNGSSAPVINESSVQVVSDEQNFEPFWPDIRIDISDDIDDEAIHGRNRHRKRQARTNTR